jgi:hypothetical protein
MIETNPLYIIGIDPCNNSDSYSSICILKNNKLKFIFTTKRFWKIKIILFFISYFINCKIIKETNNYGR